jgi:phosphonopyruvate decarboxylase
MKAEQFVAALRQHGVSWFTGVPCSFFQAVYTYLENNPADRYVPAANEGTAMAMAAGAELAGARAAVLIQNSGLGNLLNPLTSLQSPYRIPGLLFVSGRGYGVSDEPQHQLMGRITKALLELADTRVQVMDADPERFAQQLAAGADRSDRRVQAFIVPKGSIDEPAAAPAAAAGALSRGAALRIAAAMLPADAVVLSTTGLTSRDWFAIDDSARSFYAMGSMGHVMSVALGVAVTRPALCTVVLDGDGALLMHLGALSTIGAAAPRRFIHLVIDNGRYESTGGQRTTAASTDFAAIARACGYRCAEDVGDADALRAALRSALATEGPVLVRIRVGGADTASSGKPARITARLSAPEIAQRFAGFIAETVIDGTNRARK